MKKLIFLLCLMLPLLCAAQRIAVLEFKPGVGVSINDVDGLSSIFVTYFHPRDYTLVERSQIDRVIDEQNFQRTSLTEQQMVKIGEILNLSKVVIGNINVIMGEYNVDVRVINVESGTIAATEGTAFNQGSYREGMKNLAINLANKLSPIQEQQPTVLQVQANQSRTYTKEELRRKGFRFNENLRTFVPVDGINGSVTIQAFVGGESTDDHWGYTAKKLDESWYISGENIDGKMNGLMILLANGSKKSSPDTFIGYVCDGYIAYPLLSLGSGNADFLPTTHRLYGRYYRYIGVQEIRTSYSEYTSLRGDEYNNRPMFIQLMKIYGTQIASPEFLTQGCDGNFDIKQLNENFDSFMNSNSYILPIAWEDNYE